MTHKSIHKGRSKRSSRNKRINKSKKRISLKKRISFKKRIMSKKRSNKSRSNSKKRINKMRGGFEIGVNGANIPTTTAILTLPTSGPPIYGSPQATANMINAANAAQSYQDKVLAGGFYKKSKSKKQHTSKKQRGGMTASTMCTGALLNSADGYGYIPPTGCIQVPVLQNYDAQNLATRSVHIMATGQANAQYDKI
jgi:hypothetical protein